jgi:hypothetical protein
MENDLFDKIIYCNSPDNKYRYALGTKGNNTLYCFGINPSTATPEKYDPTVTRVRNTANKFGFDSFVMLNLYPQRATDPINLDKQLNLKEHRENLNIIADIVEDNSTVWAAWGDLIQYKRYLGWCLNQIRYILSIKNPRWVRMGELTKNGNPRHPLYLKCQPFTEYPLSI